MDALVSAALHEIAVEALQGCSLPKLWSGLQGAAAASELELDSRVKQILWQQLLHVPGITFLISKAQGSQTLEAYHPSIQLVEEAEKLGVHVVAPEGLRDSCLGLYDGKLSDAAISKDQRELLERLAKARSQGVTQSQLGKEFKTGGNKMFYVVKSLEARGLVVRHATIVRTHQPASQGKPSKYIPIVATNLVHLSRYEKEQNLGSHARYEIPSSSKSNHSHNNVPGSRDLGTGEDDGNQATEEVLINDDYPAMQQICEKLESADDKVMVVSDLKLDLNFRFANGHRSWRRLAKRLQDAGMVEIFDARISESKVTPCIRLLKSYSTKALNAGNDDPEAEATLRGVKRGAITEQVVESVLDRQIYDLIDNSGPAGLYMMDIWKTLGLNNKRNYFRVTGMLSKNCIVQEAEQHKKSMLYRLRTAPNAILASIAALPPPIASTDLEPQYVTPLAQIAPVSTAKIRRKPADKVKKEKERQERQKQEKERGEWLEKEKERLKKEKEEENKQKEKERERLKEHEEDAIEGTTGTPSAMNNLLKGPEESNDCRELAVVDLSIVKVDEDEPLVAPTELQYPNPLQTTTAIQREIRVMQRLHEEKFVPRVELHRWIEESERESGKDTMMDRKTLTRLLQKLQREGRVKVIALTMPGLTNCGRSRQSEVVLLPEVHVEHNVLTQVHDRIRQFDMISRGYGSSKVKADASTVPVLTSVKQIYKGGKKKHIPPAVLTEAEKSRTLSENGFIPAKMVRVRMLHVFLWSYVNDTSAYADDDLVMKLGDRCSRVFSLALAVKKMPLDLFLQVIGSTKSTAELEPYTNKGNRLCDLPESECSSLLVSHANSRLSWLIDILRRLKLIRLVMGTGVPLDHARGGSLEASLIYAMEIQPYIEEPAPQPLSTLSLDAFDLTPRARHDFTLTSNESLENYWQTLEFFFSGAVPSVARRAFPGTSVPELFGLRSWISLRVMTAEQRKRLMKRVEEGGEERRLSHAECLLLARELNLSPEQVLRVSYEKNRKYRLLQLGRENDGASSNEVSKGHRIKRNERAGVKRAITDADLVEVAHVRAFKRQRELEKASAAEDASEPMSLADIVINASEGDTVAFFDEVEEDEEEDRGTEENPLNNLKTISKLKTSRRKRFPWSESLDRILICCYTRQRAILGARNQRVDWASIPNLPANPASCRRRIAILKTDPAIRKALMNLCTVLSARYMKLPENILLNSTTKKPNIESVVTEAVTQSSPNKHTVGSPSNTFEEQEPWDSFDDTPVASALNEVMRLRSIAKAISNSKRLSGVKVPKPAKKVERRSRKVATSLSSIAKDTGNALVPATRIAPVPLRNRELGKASIDQSGDAAITAQARSRAPRERKRKKAEKPASLGELTNEEMVRKSLGIANAVELVKLVLLNAASAEVPVEVVDALRRCEESHVFAAYNFLRYQEYAIVGGNGQPHVLSQKFFFNASASRFPSETGHEALSTTQWLAKHDIEMDEDWVPLPSENFCGQLIQLLGVVSDGELIIAPFLPEAGGVGESEDNKNVVIGTKRKTEGGQEIQFMKPKIQRADSSSPGFRRERGFPGIQVCIHRASKSVGELVDAAVSQSSDRGDHSNDDMDVDPVPAEALVADVTMRSSGDASETTESRELDTALPSETQESDVAAGDVPESTEATVDEFDIPSAGGKASESIEAMEVDLLMPGNVAEPQGAGMIDVADPSESMEADVSTPSAAHVPDSKREEVNPATPSTALDPLEASEIDPVPGRDDPSPELEACIRHFCSTSQDASDSNLDPALLKLAAHEIVKAGKEGLSVPQLASLMAYIDHEMTEELSETYISALETFDVVKQVNAYDHVRVIAAVHSFPYFIHIKAKKEEKSAADAGASGEGSEGLARGFSTMATLTSIATGSKDWTGLNTSVHPTGTISQKDEELEVTHSVPILPWLDANGGVNTVVLKNLTRRVLGLVMLNPGILEEHLVNQLRALNPQTARQLLQVLVLDGHLKVRKFMRSQPPSPPGLLSHLMKTKLASSPKPTFGTHYYANGTSGHLL